MNPAIIGALINSALYLVCVFVAGMITGHAWAWKLAIAGMGVTYLSYHVSFWAVHVQNAKILNAGNALVIASICVGALAGLALLF